MPPKPARKRFYPPPLPPHTHTRSDPKFPRCILRSSELPAELKAALKQEAARAAAAPAGEACTLLLAQITGERGNAYACGLLRYLMSAAMSACTSAAEDAPRADVLPHDPFPALHPA